MRDDPWKGLVLIEELRRRREARPRRAGWTMVIDVGLGLRETEDLLEVAGEYVDLWKLSFGTSALVPTALLTRKIALIEARGIHAMPGGTLFEAAVLQQHCRVFLGRARELGFSAVEIADGTLPLPAFRRKRIIQGARQAGLIPITEVGKKDPRLQPGPVQLAETALQDLEWGAEQVIVEARESGKGVGVYDREGNLLGDPLETMARILGPRQDRIIWEAPLKPQQAGLIARFGVNVGLGNVDPRQVLALEALRIGLRFETLQPVAEALRASGKWIPEDIEGEVEACHERR
jgi:phosphosulfolactate synthase